MKSILVINGPNLNLLGLREPEIYGKQSLQDLERQLQTEFPEIDFSFFQSNHEGEIIDCIQTTANNFEGIVINAAAYTHTSIAIADALIACRVPYIEVHISNLYKREKFRQHSFLAAHATGIIQGLGFRGYSLAVRALI